MEGFTMQRATRLPARFPANTKYVLEARGSLVYRSIEFPDGRIVTLSPRKALTCTCAERMAAPAMSPAADIERDQHAVAAA
jgi:hypothetical protein